MEAKDTVKPCGDEHCQPYCHEAQAEITWDKAIREVVEWITNHGGSLDGIRTEWQAKLKEWGINNAHL